MSKKNIFSQNDLNIVFLTFGFVLGLLFFSFFSPLHFNNGKKSEVEIPAGATLSSVAEMLKSQGIISSKTRLKAAAFLNGSQSKIKAGHYEIPNGINYFELVTMLTNGGLQKQISVTIPEGIWQFNLAGLVAKKLSLDSSKIMKLSSDKNFLNDLGINQNSIEGYLLPETYFFHEGVSEIQVLSRLKLSMDAIFGEDALLQMKKLDMTKHEILTLASIIDGESNIENEFKRISGVYHKRLNLGWGLEADPTIQYLKRESRNKNRVLYKDLEINSPYNTYMYRGLPPGPINNPGRKAVIAALYPEDNEYYYFVADGTGGHVFSNNLNEHNQNVAKYRRWRETQR